MQWQLITLFYEENCKKDCLGPNWGLHSIQRYDSHSNVQGMHSNMGYVFKLKNTFQNTLHSTT